MSTIELKSIGKRYADGTRAVDDVSLRIEDGEFVILVGPSGCGKSTTLRMIAGLEEITEGELLIADRRVNEQAAKDRDLAMVFQSYALYPHMSVAKNMGFALKLAGVDRREIDRKVHEAAELLDLVDQLERRPAQLSGGQRQRVAMGRAIVRDPKAFLMDEPLSNLDAKLRVEMRGSIARLQQQLGTTTVYVTHDQTEAMTLGDRVAVMRNGVLQQVAAPHELYERPVNAFVAGFIGSPAMNLFDADTDGAQVRLPFGAIPLPERLRRVVPQGGGERRVRAGLRPEAFEDAQVAGDRPGLAFDATVELVESMGSDIYVHLSIGAGEHVVARLSSESAIREPGRARLWLDPQRLHLFDAVTGDALDR